MESFFHFFYFSPMEKEEASKQEILGLDRKTLYRRLEQYAEEG